MIFPIKTTLKNYFNNLLHTLHPILNLKPREIDVMASILLIDYTNREKIEQEQLQKLLFSKAVKKKIRESLSSPMTAASLNTTISKLRKSKLLQNKKINPFLIKFYPNSRDTEINYQISLTDDV